MKDLQAACRTKANLNREAMKSLHSICGKDKGVLLETGKLSVPFLPGESESVNLSPEIVSLRAFAHCGWSPTPKPNGLFVRVYRNCAISQRISPSSTITRDALHRVNCTWNRP